jgi:hypothetical protein
MTLATLTPWLAAAGVAILAVLLAALLHITKE